MEKQIQLAIESLLRDKDRITHQKWEVKETQARFLREVRFALQILESIKNGEFE